MLALSLLLLGFPSFGFFSHEPLEEAPTSSEARCETDAVQDAIDKCASTIEKARTEFQEKAVDARTKLIQELKREYGKLRKLSDADEARRILVVMKEAARENAKLAETGLMEKLRLPSAVVRGTWTKEGGKLVADQSPGAMVQLHDKVPKDFELEMWFEAIPSGGGAIVVVFPIAKQQLGLQLGWLDTAGFEMLDNKRSNANSTTVRFKIEPGRSYWLSLKVKGSKATAKIDGIVICEVDVGDRTARAMGQYATVPQTAIGLSSNNSRSAFYGISLK